MTLVDTIAWLLVIVPAFPLLMVAVLVYRKAWRSRSASLWERSVVAVRDLLASSGVALVALNRQFEWGWPSEVVVVVLGVSCVLIGLFSAYWLIQYVLGRFR